MRRSTRQASRSEAKETAPAIVEASTPSKKSTRASKAKVLSTTETTTVKILLVGGCGFVGGHLALAFLAKGWQVCVSDVTPLPEFLKEYTSTNSLWRYPLQYSRIDLANEQDTEIVIRSFNPSLVISIAGWGMSTFDMLSPRCWTINYEGTKTLVNICQRLNIRRFIFTSTYNVVFHGQKIENGDESLPYAPDSAHVDEYSKSKTHAERYVLAAASKDDDSFVAVALRPGAIYGEDEMRHLPRIVHLMDLWMYSPAQIGSAVVDWVHIDNLIQSYEKVAEKLLFGNKTEIQLLNGQAYCINDNDPITNEEFLGPLCRARCRPEPILTLPVSIMVQVSSFFEFLYFRKLPTVKLFTRAEIYKAGQTHYFPPIKAKQHFGYEPSITTHVGAKQIAARYRIPTEKIRSHSHSYQVPFLYWWIIIFLGMFLLAVVAFEPTMTNYATMDDTDHHFGGHHHHGDCCHKPWLAKTVSQILSTIHALWIQVGNSSNLGFYSDPVSGGIPASLSPAQWPSLLATDDASFSRFLQIETLLEVSKEVDSFVRYSLFFIFVSLLQYTKQLAYAIFQTQWLLQQVFFWACIAHFAESVYAVLLAKYWCYLDTYSCILWWIQTFCLGYPSLSLLKEFHQNDVQLILKNELQSYMDRKFQEKKQRLFGSS